MLNLEILSQFVAFADYGTLSRAAEALHISQPSLSRAMQRLENDLQVNLFTRGKNHLELSETGKIAVNYARKVLDEADRMASSVQMYDRQLHTIFIGSVAPFPMWTLLPQATSVYPEMTINGELRDETTLLQGLIATDQYNLIILPYQLDDPRCESFHYMDENLMLSIPETHPLASRKDISFSDFDGETMLVFADIGFWDHIHRIHLPHSRFIVQPDRADLGEIINHSDYPTFITDRTIERDGMHGNGRVAVPIRDTAAHQHFYLTYQKSNRARLQCLLRLLTHIQETCTAGCK